MRISHSKRDSQTRAVPKEIRGDQDIIEKFHSNCNSLVIALRRLNTGGYELFIPCSVPLATLPRMISPLKGRKTITRNFTKPSQP